MRINDTYLNKTQFGLSRRPRLSSVLIHMKQKKIITNVDCVVCNENYNYVSCLYEAIIITDINCVVCKYNAVWLLLSMLPLFQTFIIDYNYVCSLVGLPIIYELLLQYLVRNEIRISAQIKIV